MVSNKQSNEFAIKWLEKYKNLKSTEHEVEKGFSEECSALGFEMDCGNSFEDAFPNALNNYNKLEQIIDRINDTKLLGSAIFSKWRYITHWSFGESLLSPENRAWFIIAFSRLSILSSEDSSRSFALQGQAKKIKIISNNVCYGPCPMLEEEVEQHLTMTDDGRVWFSGYNFGNTSGKYERGRTKQFSLDKEKADRVFSAFSRFFSGEFEDIFATDIGFWELIITNTEGQEFVFKGSLCADYEIDGIDLSEMLRDALGIESLFVFDGDDKPDRIERVSIDYHRVTKIKPKVPTAGTFDKVTWDYSEQLVIDRETETIEHIQRIGTGCIITRKYHVEEGVSNFFDDQDADSLFENIKVNPPDVADNLNEIKEYNITVDFKKRPQQIITGSFDLHGLPEDWPKFAEEIFDFMQFYGWGEILNSSLYRKVKRRAGDYMFCSVEFSEGGKNYYYISDDDTIKAGDLVIVPTGEDGHTATVKVVNVEYFSEENLPFSIEKAKYIIRRE